MHFRTLPPHVPDSLDAYAPELDLYRYTKAANFQWVARARRLGHDFPEDDNRKGGHQEARHSARQIRHQNGQQRIHRHVAQQESAQEQVAVG